MLIMKRLEILTVRSRPLVALAGQGYLLIFAVLKVLIAF